MTNCNNTDTTQGINYIQNTDRVFTLKAILKNSGEPKDLSDFYNVVTGDALSLALPGADGDIILTLEDSTEGRLAVVSESAGLAGKIQVSIKDSSTLNTGLRQNMELVIKEGPGPDFDVSRVQFIGQLHVIEKLFDS